MAQGSAQCPVTGSSCFALSLARDSVNQHFSSTTKSELTSVFDSIGGLLVFFAGRFQKSPQTASLATEKAGQTKRRAVRNPPADLSENESSHIFFPRSQHTRESAVSPTESCAVGIRLARRRRPTRTALCSVFLHSNKSKNRILVEAKAGAKERENNLFCFRESRIHWSITCLHYQTGFFRIALIAANVYTRFNKLSTMIQWLAKINSESAHIGKERWVWSIAKKSIRAKEESAFHN